VIIVSNTLADMKNRMKKVGYDGYR